MKKHKLSPSSGRPSIGAPMFVLTVGLTLVLLDHQVIGAEIIATALVLLQGQMGR